MDSTNSENSDFSTLPSENQNSAPQAENSIVPAQPVSIDTSDAHSEDNSVTEPEDNSVTLPTEVILPTRPPLRKLYPIVKAPNFIWN